MFAFRDRLKFSEYPKEIESKILILSLVTNFIGEIDKDYFPHWLGVLKTVKRHFIGGLSKNIAA